MEYKGIKYTIRAGTGPTEWKWSIQPPIGPRRLGTTRGSQFWAHMVTRRAIDVWLLMNPAATLAQQNVVAQQVGPQVL